MSKWISTPVTLPATHRSRRARVWYRPEDSFLLPLQVRRTTLFEIDRSNHLFSERDAKLLVHPGAPVAKALLASLGPKSSTLQSVRCAAYPHEIVHDGGTRREYRRGLELWPPVREAGTARSPVPHLARLTPEVVAALRNRTRVVRRISLEWFRHRTWGQRNGRHREGGHFGSALCGCLRLYGRSLACNTLPLSARHLHPGIGPANIHVKRLTRCIGPFTLEVSRRYGRIAKNGDFQVGVAGSVPFHRLQFGQRLDPASYFPIAARTHELVGQQRGE